MSANRSRLDSSGLLDVGKPKTVAAGLRPIHHVEAKPDPKPLGEPLSLGRAIERALVLADISKKEISFRMGYTDQSSISKWIGDIEPPRFDKLWQVRELQIPLVIQLSRLAGFQVRTTLSTRRTA